MAITELQRQKRAQGIGASEAAMVLGCHPKHSAWDVWAWKTGRAAQDEMSDDARRGLMMEPVIAAYAEEDLGVRLVKPTATYIHAGGVLRANLDRQVAKAQRGATPVELKSSLLRDGWGEAGTDQVPEAVLIQVTAQMMCCEAQSAFVARMGAFFGVTTYRVPLNESLAEAILEGVSTFWERHVEADIPPAESYPSLEVAKLIRPVDGKIVSVPPDVAAGFAAARQARLAAEKAEDDARSKLDAAMVDGAVFDCPGWVVRKPWINQASRLNQTKLKTEHPDVYAQCCEPGGYYKLEVKEAKS